MPLSSSSSSRAHENDAMMLVLKETSTFETLARDFPEHCLLVVAGGSCLFVHVFSRVLMSSGGGRSSSGGRKREVHQSTTKEVLSPVRGGGGERNDLATTIEEKRFSRLRTWYNFRFRDVWRLDSRRVFIRVVSLTRVYDAIDWFQP